MLVTYSDSRAYNMFGSKAHRAQIIYLYNFRFGSYQIWFRVSLMLSFRASIILGSRDEDVLG